MQTLEMYKIINTIISHNFSLSENTQRALIRKIYDETDYNKTFIFSKYTEENIINILKAFEDYNCENIIQALLEKGSLKTDKKIGINILYSTVNHEIELYDKNYCVFVRLSKEIQEEFVKIIKKELENMFSDTLLELEFIDFEDAYKTRGSFYFRFKLKDVEMTNELKQNTKSSLSLLNEYNKIHLDFELFKLRVVMSNSLIEQIRTFK